MLELRTVCRTRSVPTSARRRGVGVMDLPFRPMLSSPVPARIHSALRLALHALYTQLSECRGARRNYLAETSHQVVRRRERRAFNPRDQPSPVIRSAVDNTFNLQRDLISRRT